MQTHKPNYVLHNVAINFAAQHAPTALKVASIPGGLHAMVCDIYGVDGVDMKTASALIAQRHASDYVTNREALLNVEDVKEAMDFDSIPVPNYQYVPQGVSRDAWYGLHVEKCAKLVEAMDIATRGNWPTIVRELKVAHDFLAEDAYDYFCAKSQKIAKDMSEDLDSVGPEVKVAFMGTVTNAASNFFSNPTVRDAGHKLLTGAALGTGVGLTAAPLISHFAGNAAEQAMQNAKRRALETAAGTAGIAVGANQINNILNRITKQASCSSEHKESMSVSEVVDKLDGKGMAKKKEVEDKKEAAFAKLAMAMYLEQNVDNKKPHADAFRQQFKVAAIHSLHDLMSLSGNTVDLNAYGFKIAYDEDFAHNVGGVAGGLAGGLAGYGLGGVGAGLVGGVAGALGGARAGSGLPRTLDSGDAAGTAAALGRGALTGVGTFAGAGLLAPHAANLGGAIGGPMGRGIGGLLGLLGGGYLGHQLGNAAGDYVLPEKQASETQEDYRGSTTGALAGGALGALAGASRGYIPITATLGALGGAYGLPALLGSDQEGESSLANRAGRAALTGGGAVAGGLGGGFLGTRLGQSIARGGGPNSARWLGGLLGMALGGDIGGHSGRALANHLLPGNKQAAFDEEAAGTGANIGTVLGGLAMAHLNRGDPVGMLTAAIAGGIGGRVAGRDVGGNMDDGAARAVGRGALTGLGGLLGAQAGFTGGSWLGHILNASRYGLSPGSVLGGIVGAGLGAYGGGRLGSGVGDWALSKQAAVDEEFEPLSAFNPVAYRKRRRERAIQSLDGQPLLSHGQTWGGVAGATAGALAQNSNPMQKRFMQYLTQLSSGGHVPGAAGRLGLTAALPIALTSAGIGLGGGAETGDWGHAGKSVAGSLLGAGAGGVLGGTIGHGLTLGSKNPFTRMVAPALAAALGSAAGAYGGHRVATS